MGIGVVIVSPLPWFVGVVFIADQTVPEASVEEIRTLGNLVDVVEADEEAARRELLERAADEGRVVLTFEFGFHDVIFGGEAEVPAGVVCFQFEWDTPRDAAQLLVAVLADDDLELEGQFTLLDEARMRQKALPRG